MLGRTDWAFVHQNARDGLRMGVSAGGNVGERLMAVGARHYGDIRGQAIDWLGRVEIAEDRVDDRRGWLTWTGEDITGTDTEIPVQSTAGFPARGALYINGERVEYRSKDDSVFRGCSRGGR